MRILFMGTPDFAVASLKKIVEAGHEICGVFTQPDKPKNRGHKLSFSPVKEYALSIGLNVFQPEKMKDGTALDLVKNLNPDVIVVAAYGKIIPEDILNFPKYGAINVHSSILPKYRGAAPINWAILNGETETGVTIMYMAKELDAGDIIEITKTNISENEDALTLTGRLAEIGGETLIDVLDKMMKNEISRIPQDNSLSTYAKMLDKGMSEINWNKPSISIHNQVRGLIPWPCASTIIEGKTVKVFKTIIGENTNADPGTIISANKNGIEVACGDHKTIRITELQAEGGKRMLASAYLAGHPIKL